VFSLAVAAAGILLGEAAAATAVQHAAAEVGGAIVLGAVLGLAAGLLTHRIAEGEPTLLEAAGIVLLTAGLATLLEVSFILAAMVLGLVMVNTGRRGNRAFHEIEHLEWPFMVLFFVLAGASLELGALAGIGLLGAGYVALRALGLLLGAVVGGRLCRAEPVVTRWMGLALMPQAGVALGMALVVEQRFPQIGEQLLPLVIGATVVFELVGPVFTRLALRRAGETGAAGASRG
jgi:Kef-type K+ transport system membrane component KefB